MLIDELKRYGIEIVFFNHDVGGSPEEQLLLQVQGMVAEYERAKIMERSRRGKLHAARQGSVSAIGKAPYGYRYISGKETHGQAIYQIDLEKARTVRQMFEWSGQERVPLQGIGRRLDNQGILTPTGKNKWSRTSIWQILKNPAYKGTAAYGRTHAGPRRRTLRPPRGAPEQPRRDVSVCHNPRDKWIWIDVSAIVTPDLFETVQEQLAQSRKKVRQHRRGTSYLLQGVLVCKHCEYAYYGHQAQRRSPQDKSYRYGYYRCIGTDAYRFEGQRVCSNKPVRVDRLATLGSPE